MNQEIKRILLLLVIIISGFAACKKGPGEGGNSSIQGKVYVKDYNKTFTILNAEYYGQDEDVFIVYGQDLTYSDRVATAPDGSFEFKYLRTGNYKIYVYSKDSTLNSPSGDVSVMVDVVINKRKQIVIMDDITIYK